MANDANLIKNSELTPKERIERARKMGIASGVARRKNKTIRQVAEMFMNAKCPSEKECEAVAEAFGIDKDKVTHTFRVVAAVVNAAEEGNIQAVKELRSILGQDNTSEELRLKKAEIKKAEADARSDGSLAELIEGLTADDSEDE